MANYPDVTAAIEDDPLVLPADTKRKAALVACGHAADTAEAREFLDMLGLTETLTEER